MTETIQKNYLKITWKYNVIENLLIILKLVLNCINTVKLFLLFQVRPRLYVEN
jgi:hypothetical protein